MLGLAALPGTWKIAGAAIGALLIVLACVGLYIKGRSDGEAACQAGEAKAVVEAQQKADKLANELITAQAQAMAVTEKVTTVYKDRIIHAPTTNSCGPVLRDAVLGVLDTLRGSTPDPASPAPKPVH